MDPLGPFRIFHLNKRLRQDACSHEIDEEPINNDDMWANYSLFALDCAPPEVGSDQLQSWSYAEPAVNHVKRPYDDDIALPWSLDVSAFPSHQTQPVLLSAAIPEIFSSLPTLEDSMADLSVSNPFNANSINHYSVENRLSFEVPADGAVDGYIKFRIREPEKHTETHKSMNRVFEQASMAVHHRSIPGLVDTQEILHLPPNFGKNITLDATEKKLLRFYLQAFCVGRTLLSKTNFWVTCIAAIADGDECVKHALLASTAAYVLDYQPKNQKLKARANFYYRRATDLMTRALQDSVAHEVGKEESLVTSLLLLICDDIVNWEMRAPLDMEPKWLIGTRIAKKVLDNADPGFRYWHTANVQATASRTALANRIAFVDILTLPVTKLQLNRGDRMYGWLLEGSRHETEKIFGGTGLSPKLLHTFAQITYLCALLAETPTSPIFLLAATQIEKRLAELCQTSELSHGYVDPEQLLTSCHLNGDGLVETVKETTELTGETWRAAAQVYLQCRFFRLPRDHPKVIAHLEIMLRCIERMPCKGNLFSSQAPFFPIFMIGIVGVRERDREVARNWFETVVIGASSRSSVPPIWRTVQKLWNWTDNQIIQTPNFEFDNSMPINERDPWWEVTVDYLLATEGILSLC